MARHNCDQAVINHWIYGARGTDGGSLSSAWPDDAKARRFLLLDSMLYRQNVRVVQWVRRQYWTSVYTAFTEVVCWLPARRPKRSLEGPMKPSRKTGHCTLISRGSKQASRPRSLSRRRRHD